MSEWKIVPAGEAFSIVMGRQRSPSRANGPGMTPYLRSANVGDGRLDLRDVKQMDFTATERERFALRRGDVLVSEGSASAQAVGMASVWAEELPGDVCFQNTLLRFRAVPGVTEPGFAYQWCRWAYDSGAFREAASGTNIKHIGAARAAAMNVALPPRSEQRRIVDVMTAVDAQIAALEAEAVTAAQSLGPMTESLLSADDQWPVMPLGMVGTFVRGKRFTKADYTASGLGVIHYSHVHTHFGPVAREAAAFVSEDARPRLRLASTGDVVIATTSEDLAGVGKATVWLGPGEVAVHDDAQIYRHSLEPLFASFVFASPAFQRQKVQYAGGSKVTRISGADLAKIEIPIPPAEVQAAIGSALAEHVEQVTRVEGELANLRMFRSTLLTALLNQEIEIPESYDDLLEAVS